jgi:hypothetical protein
MARAVLSTNRSTFPRLPPARRRRRLSFGLTALFAAVTAVAVVSGAARMPVLVGFLFAIDGLVVAMGLYFVRQGCAVSRAIESRPHDVRCAWAQIRFGLLLIVFGTLTFGAAAIINR